MVDKNQIEEIKQTEGEVRGTTLNTDKKHIIEKEGEQALEKLRGKLEELGFADIYSDDINQTGWYPLSWRIVSILLLRDVLGWGNEEIFDMGFSAPSHSFIVKTILRYFVSPEKTFVESSKYWEKHYSKGNLVVKEVDMEEKKLVLWLKDFEVPPLLCEYYKGYFKRITCLTVGQDREKVKNEETKCMSEGDEYHEFIITWE